MKKIAIFASGSGSNAENIVRYFENNPEIGVELILSNRADAYVLERARTLNVPTYVFNREEFYSSEDVLKHIKEHDIDFIVLAGFLWKVPDYLLREFPNRIINIHPALLPSYGGKGMYGSKVHEAVLANKEKVSGITIHYVNSNYDEGDIFFQAKCNIAENETPDTLALKIHDLEYEYFPRIIEQLVEKL